MAQMRRMLLLAVTAALLVAGSADSAAGARDKPMIIQIQGCQYLFDGLYGGIFNVVGLEPNTEYVFSYGPGNGAGWFTTDDEGAYLAVGGGESSEPFEQTFQVLLDPNHSFRDGDESIVVEGHFAWTRPCTDFPGVPTAKSQCRKGGWRNFPTTIFPFHASRFKNQGDCVRFVAKDQTRRAAAGLRE
jgi:hypothetical protein